MDKEYSYNFEISFVVFYMNKALLHSILQLGANQLATILNEYENDDHMGNSKISEILKSEQSTTFISDILSKKGPEQILQYLETNQNQGKLKFGRKDQLSNPDGAYVIISDEKQVYTILFYYNSKYFDTMNNQTYESLSDRFRGKRSIWINLL